MLAHHLSGAWGRGLPLAVLSSLGADGLVLVVLALLGVGVERVRRGLAVTWTLAGLGVLIGLYALLNVAVIVEIGRPMTLDMRWFDFGADEAGAMWTSDGAKLFFVGLLLYAVAARPVLRSFERRTWLHTPRAAIAVSAYGVAAVAFVALQPQIASIYGLHRNAVAEVLLSALDEAGLRGGNGVRGVLPEAFKPPDDPSFLGPVSFDRSVKPKHLVLWFQESTGARYTTLFDPNAQTTPNAARLAEHALQYTRYYANCPLSEKAIFGILYGLHPYPANKPIAHVNPRLARESLMEALTSRGYRAGFFTGALFGFGDKQKLLSERGFDVMVDGESVPNRDGWWRSGWGIDDTPLVEEALRWLDARPDPDQPQFIVMVTIIPHNPYQLPTYATGIENGTTRKDKYDDVLHYGDSIFGKFYAALEERGLADDTLVVWTGDHGEGFEQHPGNLSHGSFVYEENVHVPLLFINPQMFPEPVTSERMGSHVDLMPTILDLLGEPIPEGGDGQSLVAEDYEYRPVFTVSFMRDHLGAVRDGWFKYIYNFDTGYEEVFDLAQDPLETQNIVDGFDVERVGTWRSWTIEHQAVNKERLENWPDKGPSYLKRSLKGMRIYLEDGETRLPCTIPRRGAKAMGCEGQPDFVSVGLSREKIRQVSRECFTIHPPERGALVVEFPVLDPPPTFLGAGLLDSARTAGGAPVEITWRVGDQEPIVMTVDDARIDAFATARLPRGGAPAPVRVEVRSDDWTHRQGCLILSP